MLDCRGVSTEKIAFYIYYLLIISPGSHVYVYYMVFAKLLQEISSGAQGTCPTYHILDTPLVIVLINIFM